MSQTVKEFFQTSSTLWVDPDLEDLLLTSSEEAVSREEALYLYRNYKEKGFENKLVDAGQLKSKIEGILKDNTDEMLRNFLDEGMSWEFYLVGKEKIRFNVSVFHIDYHGARLSILINSGNLRETPGVIAR